MNELIRTAVLTMVVALAGIADAQEVITKQYDEGGVYEGTFLNGKQHGTGTYTLPSGYTYSGEWANGEIVGQGRAVFPDGSIYEGAFERGEHNGTGTNGSMAGSKARALRITPMALAIPAVSSMPFTMAKA